MFEQIYKNHSCVYIQESAGLDAFIITHILVWFSGKLYKWKLCNSVFHTIILMIYYGFISPETYAQEKKTCTCNSKLQDIGN